MSGSTRLPRPAGGLAPVAIGTQIKINHTVKRATPICLAFLESVARVIGVILLSHASSMRPGQKTGERLNVHLA